MCSVRHNAPARSIDCGQITEEHVLMHMMMAVDMSTTTIKRKVHGKRSSQMMVLFFGSATTLSGIFAMQGSAGVARTRVKLAIT